MALLWRPSALLTRRDQSERRPKLSLTAFLMLWVSNLVRKAAKFVEDDGEDPDHTLAKALGGGSPGGGEEDDDNPYREQARVDQVLQFFEFEAAGLAGFIAEDADQAEELESKRISYYNMVSSIIVQNERIAHFVDELLHLRTDLREIRQHRGRIPSEKLAELSRIKLDIGDVKTKRYFKERARKEAMVEIVPIIVKVKTARLLAQTAFEHGEATRAGVTEERRNGTQPLAASTSESSCSNAAHASSRASATQARRRNARHRYSDEELKHLLKDD